MLKKCPKCKKLKELNKDNFNIDKARKSNFYPYCKDCVKEKDKMIYKINELKVKKRALKYYRENKDKFKANSRKLCKIKSDKFYNGGWKIAKIKSKRIDRSYVILKFRGYANFSVFEHRYLVMKNISRCLKDYEVIHHKDRNGLNNELSNLELIPHDFHDEHQHYKSIITRQQKKIEKLKEIISRLNPSERNVA